MRARAWQEERATDGTGADCCEQYPVETRTAMQLRAREQRQQRPVGAREQEKADRARQRRTQCAVVARITYPGADRAAETLGRQPTSLSRRRSPGEHDGDDTGVAPCIDKAKQRMLPFAGKVHANARHCNDLRRWGAVGFEMSITA